MIEQNKIDEKLLAYFLNELDDVGRKEIEVWLEECECNKEYFREFQRVYLEFQWGVYAREVKSDFNVVRKRLKKQSILQVWYGVAAAVVILLSVGGVLLWNSEKVEEKPVQEEKKKNIKPGKSQAILVLSSGEEVAMGNVAQQLEEKDGTSVVVSEIGRISYEVTEGNKMTAKDTTKVMNRLVIPRGGEFNLTLSDGTRVWLNAETELCYPVQFNGKERVVYLKGEAYFEVSKNKKKPFRVQVDDVAVKVFGTEFNVNTYNNIETVLVTGSVSMNQGGKEVLLKPNQKGVFDQSSGKIMVEDVDVLAYISWKNGDFIFRNESLNSIMDKLSRWYGLEVFYQDAELQSVRLSGNLKRYKDVQELFVSFEKISDARFEVQGNKVIVSSK